MAEMMQQREAVEKEAAEDPNWILFSLLSPLSFDKTILFTFFFSSFFPLKTKGLSLYIIIKLDKY
jgi:hypothetical protein